MRSAPVEFSPSNDAVEIAANRLAVRNERDLISPKALGMGSECTTAAIRIAVKEGGRDFADEVVEAILISAAHVLVGALGKDGAQQVLAEAADQVSAP